MKLIKQLNKLFKFWPKILLLFSLVFLAYTGFLIWQIWQTIYHLEIDQSQIEKIEIKRDLWNKAINEIENRDQRLQKALDKTYKDPF